MSLRAPHAPFYLFFPAPPVPLPRASQRRSLDRKHLLPFGRRSQISGGLSAPLPPPARSPYRWRLQVSAAPRRSAPLKELVRASPLRVASRPWPQASPRLHRAVRLQARAFFARRACPLVVFAVRLVAGPTRLQPAPANSLLVNW